MGLMGVDSSGVAVPRSKEHVSRHTLFLRGIPLIENLVNLASLSKPRVQIYAFPLAMRGLEAILVRIIAVEEW